MSDSILPEGNGVRIRTDSDNKARLLPSPFPSLTGRTRGITEIQKRWEETYGMANLPPLQVNRVSEMSVDCWERRSPSGKKIRRVVNGMVAIGIFR
jgi:hypothetical protein